MSENLGTPLPPVEEPQKKNNTVLIIVIVVLVMLCCCCVAASSLWLFWSFGDELLGITWRALNVLVM